MTALVTVHSPFDLARLGADAQRARRMPEAHGFAFAAARGEVDQRARDRRGRTDRDGGRAHHRVVQLAHRQRAHEQVDIAGGTFLPLEAT